jgi:signal transduction histidine kinase
VPELKSYLTAYEAAIICVASAITNFEISWIVDITKNCDRGPGIATAELTKIFEPYYRSSKNNDKSIGTGLGLAIVNRVFARHAGNVIALHHDGGGLTLRISIPAAELT